MQSKGTRAEVDFLEWKIKVFVDNGQGSLYNKITVMGA